MTATPHILVVEDDREISALISRYLRANQCRVSVAASGRDVGPILDASRINLIVLDLMLPGEDGFSVFKRVRQRSYIPVIILTAKADEIDRIVGLEMGADDYLSKPFNPRELLARIRAVMRRSTMAATAPVHAPARTLTFQGWTVDRVAREVTSPQGVRVAVIGAEFDLLQALCERPGLVLTRDQLLDLTQGRQAAAFERSVDILISRLRRKIERDPHSPEMIKTVRSGGYLFAPQVTSP